jgi:hypothetical protein
MQITFSTDSVVEAVTILEALSGAEVGRQAAGVENAKAEVRRAASGADDWANDAAPEPPADDPWADDAPAQRQESRSGQSSRAASESKGDAKIPRSGTYTVDTPSGQRRWTFGRDDAPQCECGMTAALNEGKTNGKVWGRWACPLKYSKDTYKGACNFSTFKSSDKE